MQRRSAEERIARAAEGHASLALCGSNLALLHDALGLLPHLRSLELHQDGPSELPEWLGELTGLETLSIKAIPIVDLPRSIGGLSNLRSLRLENNDLSTIPESVAALPHLTTLRVSGNRITTLPSWLAALPKLQHLILDENEITTLPNWFNDLHQLTTLNLGRNQLSELPDSIGNLVELRDLDFSENQLCDLPPSIGQLIKLRHLDLRGNSFESVPDQLRSLSELDRLDLADNPVERETGPLQAVGYWLQFERYRRSVPDRGESADNRCPDPTSLVDPAWQPGDRAAIGRYLDGGLVHTHWRGLSYCRFDCGISSPQMGSRCLTDGTWVWPEGLAHYVVAHNVRLPDTFVDHMRSQDWTVPENLFLPPIRARRRDFSDWIDWGEAQTAAI